MFPKKQDLSTLFNFNLREQHHTKNTENLQQSEWVCLFWIWISADVHLCYKICQLQNYPSYNSPMKRLQVGDLQVFDLVRRPLNIESNLQIKWEADSRGWLLTYLCTIYISYSILNGGYFETDLNGLLRVSLTNFTHQATNYKRTGELNGNWINYSTDK